MKKWIIFLLVLTIIVPMNIAQAQDSTNPETVTIAGTLQSELGCAGDWMPECDKTFLSYDAEDDVWQGTFLVQPGNDEDKKGSRYKAAINGLWNENYGSDATPGGADILLPVNEPTEVKFYFDYKTHWITDNVTTVIAVVVGDFQKALGCSNDNDASCLRSWLQDPDGDGIFTFVTRQLPAGTYTASVALNEDGNQVAIQPTEFTVKTTGDEIYFGFNAQKGEFLVSNEGAPRGNLAKLKAHWVTRQAILWNVTGSPKYTYKLHYASQGGLVINASGISGGEEFALTYKTGGPGDEVFKRFPHLAGSTTLVLSDADLNRIPEILKGQVVVSALDQNGKLVDAAGLQIPGVLDDLYHYVGALGVSWENNQPVIRVWAPTAQKVSLIRYADSTSDAAQAIPMSYDKESGVWGLTGETGWKNQFYQFEVQVFVPSTGKVETNLVTDPYSFSLSTNSKRSQIVDLDDPALKPVEWDKLRKPELDAPEDIVLYELHVRDFSASDDSVPENLRGTFKAFTVIDSNGMKHLRRLAEAGLTHVHLLPAFDISSVNEDKSTWKTVDEVALSTLPGDSDAQQAAVNAIVGDDGFNWGYDPQHYTTPEGSYATDPDGATRVLEFREMVQALNQSGLRVVMDVVYNHTSASGQNPNSVLDKIVPGYYYRLNGEGKVERSTCCDNTASEHAMMEKLLVDSVLTWATAYKVDGFRFDLMGHHMLSNMTNLRTAVDGLTLSKQGVDGKTVYIYGEGWDFGEVGKNARGVNAAQPNLAGSGIGSFNDRLRDAVRGGGAFNPLPEQGFVTGLLLQPNQYENRTLTQQQAKLFDYMDWIRIGLAGNLRSYSLLTAAGFEMRGEQIGYNGQHAGYTSDPQENIVYISAHDNETLWDAIQAKAPAEMTLSERVRMQNLGMNMVMLSQGVPFFHAGDELLRSKSLDRNSYNSGDWFNKLDFTYQTNNWAVGLPPSGDNSDKWDIIRPLLADPTLKASPQDIQFALSNFETFLKIRKSSSLFRLQTAEEIEKRLAFFGNGPEQTPGVIAYWLKNDDEGRLDDPFAHVIVVFNATAQSQTVSLPAVQGLSFELHPALLNGTDDIVRQSAFDSASGGFTTPPRTTAVFVVKSTPLQNEHTLALTIATGIAALGALGAGLIWALRRKKTCTSLNHTPVSFELKNPCVKMTQGFLFGF